MNRIWEGQPMGWLFLVYMGHVERVRRTDYADGTDMLALKRERGRLAQNSKKIDLENYKDLKVWKWMESPTVRNSTN